MKILILSYLPIEPADSGGKVRVSQLATNLASRHQVTVACPSDGAVTGEHPYEVHQLPTAGRRQLIDPSSYRAVAGAVRERKPDVLLLEYAWQGLHAFLARLGSHIPVVLDAFDVLTVRFRREGSPLWPLVSAYERVIVRRAQKVFAVSSPDRQQLVRLGAAEQETHVVPNGVDTKTFHPDAETRASMRAGLGISANERLLFFFGRLDYAPNAQAVRVLTRDIMPALGPEYRLAVAGRGAAPVLQHDTEARIRFLGPVDPLPAYINAADAVVAPIRSGSGSRLKVLESLACGTPVVTTSVGAEGIEREVCGPGLSVTDGWLRFIGAIERAAALGRVPPSPQLTDAYDWRNIVARIPLN
jgi:glycosyltransferase involved in cell wall biosynthesis